MKTTYTNEQLQEAIDEACKDTQAAHPEASDSIALSPYFLPVSWNEEQAARLTLARAFIDNLPSTEKPDPYAELKKAHAEGKVIQYNCNSDAKPDWEDIDDPQFGDGPECYRIKPEPETFQAHGKTWTRHTPGDPMPCDGERIVQTLMKGFAFGGLGKASDFRWSLTKLNTDIRGWRYDDEPQPEQSANAKAYDEFQEELEAVWNGEPWTPQVGDVVRLKSGGPLMTVARLAEDDPSAVLCEWFDRSNRYDAGHITIACLEPATKEDAR
jgi:uncharacterized protein YodC (DUF2158 family)